MSRSGRCAVRFAVAAAACLWAAVGAAADAGEGSLTTAEFPDVVKFDFKKVQESYQQAGENVGKVIPVLDDALEKGRAAVQAGEAVRKDPTEEKKRQFLGMVLGFVEGAGRSKADIERLAADVRGLHAQIGILYVEATTQTAARVEALRKEYEREEIKLKDIVARNKAARKAKTLSDWELRKLFEEEKRQAQKLTRLANRVAFQDDFCKALRRADQQSVGDFNLYAQFFAEAADALEDIGDLSSNLPILVEQSQLAAAMAENMPSRGAAIKGFAKIESMRAITRTISEQLMEFGAEGLDPAKDAAGGAAKTFERRTQVYRRWIEDGEPVGYKRLPKGTP